MAMTIGNCSPCCFGLTDENQIVSSAVLFKSLGWSGLTDLVPFDYLPNVVYLRKNSYSEDALGVFEQQITGYDALGNLVETFASGPLAGRGYGSPEVSTEWIYDGYGNLVKVVRNYPAGRAIQELTNPYTYENARDAAVVLLDAMDLINPARYYDFTKYDSYGTPSTYRGRLCYPSEYAQFGDFKTNRAVVYKNAAGVTIFGIYNDAWFYLMNGSLDISSPLSWDAFKGATHSTNAFPPPPVDGLVWAGKSAMRHKTTLTHRRDGLRQQRPGTANRITRRVYHYDGTPNDDYYTVLPLPGLKTAAPDATGNPYNSAGTILPGETIFLPKDVPGDGSSIWSA